MSPGIEIAFKTSETYLFAGIILVLGIMIGWEIAIAGGSLAGLIALFVEASKPDTSHLFAIGGIVMTVVFFLSAGDSLRKILIKDNFIIKVSSYMVEGQRILLSYSDKTISTADYVALVRDLSKNIFKDIQCHKGQSENFVVLEATIHQFEKELDKSTGDATRRNVALQIVGTQLRQLKELKEKL